MLNNLPKDTKTKKLKEGLFKIYFDINKVFLTYALKDKKVTVLATFVDPAYANQGLASRMYEALIDKVLQRHYQITSKCWYVTKKLANDNRVKDLVVTSNLTEKAN